MIYSLLSLSGVLILIGYGNCWFGYSLHQVVGLAVIWVGLIGFLQHPEVRTLLRNLFSSVKKCIGVIQLFLLISIMIASFILSGAIPTLIYYGLGVINPYYFLPVGLLLCGFTTLALGSCWGTIGTIGVTLIGIASLLNIPLPITAGMIVSGAYFGDKISPASDTTILSAISTDTPLYQHIKGMIYTLIPAFLFTLLIFYLLGKVYVVHTDITPHNIEPIELMLSKTFKISWIGLSPLLVLLSMNLLRIKITVSMLVSILLSLVIAYEYQGFSLGLILSSVLTGPQDFHSGNKILETVFHHGGLMSITGSLSLTLLILMLGGLIESYGYIQTVLKSIINQLNTPLQLVIFTLLLCVLTNMVLGEAYLTIVLIGNMLKTKFKQLGLDSCTLSKTLEEGAIFSTPLIPWSTSGIFIYCTLGIKVQDYMFWSILNWLAPVLFLLFIAVNFLGTTHFKLNKKTLVPVIEN